MDIQTLSTAREPPLTQNLKKNKPNKTTPQKHTQEPSSTSSCDLPSVIQTNMKQPSDTQSLSLLLM